MTDHPTETARPTASRTRAFEKRLRRHISGRVRDYHVVTLPGFESLCRRELADLGLDGPAMTVDRGGIGFRGRLVDCQRVNLYLRTATRVLMRVDSFRASNLRRLAKNSDQIAWELFLPLSGRPEIRVKTHRSRLYHTGAIAQTLDDSIARRLLPAAGTLPAAGSQTLFVRVVDDHVVLSVDSSGAPLYKRGFKSGPARAPIRETLAAAILLMAGYDGVMPLVDPMCGSGTFSLEAAMMAKRMAPGINRQFAFMDWPADADNQWAFLKREAESRIETLARPRIFASDIDGEACRRLASTVDRNALGDAVAVMQNDFFRSRADRYKTAPGLVIINPPYGIRLGSGRQANELFAAICRHLKAYFHGWRAALIIPSPDLIARVPFAARPVPIAHGGLKLALAIGTIGR